MEVLPVSVDSSVNDLEVMSREAMTYMFEAMDEMTGGCFRKGYRPATRAERVTEWDALTPDQIEQLRGIKGDEWLSKQGAEIERFRKELEMVKSNGIPVQS